MKYPTLKQVNEATRFTLCLWWRFLPSPMNDVEVAVNQQLAIRFKEVGGFTPEISKAIGWEEQ